MLLLLLLPLYATAAAAANQTNYYCYCYYYCYSIGEINRTARKCAKHFWVKFEDGEFKNDHYSKSKTYGNDWLFVTKATDMTEASA